MFVNKKDIYILALSNDPKIADTGSIIVRLQTKCFIQSRKAGILMESNHTASSCLCVTLIIALLFFFTCLLTCDRETTSTQQISSADYDKQKEMIEHVIGVKLPESARNCRYHHKNSGMGRGTGWGYFEISRADMRNLLDTSDNLPDASEPGQHSGVRFSIEKYLEQEGESIAWWKPLTLQKRQYAQKVIGSENVTGSFELDLFNLPVIDICVGEIRDDWMGVYLIYHIVW